jgi:hypothetical protein
MRRTQTTGAHAASKLIPDLPFESLKRGCVEIRASGLVLAPRRQTRHTFITLHDNHDRFFWPLSRLVPAIAYPMVEAEPSEITPRCRDAMRLQANETFTTVLFKRMRVGVCSVDPVGRSELWR